MEFRHYCGLTALLWLAVRRTPPGDSFTLAFTLWDCRLGIVDLSVTVLEELALVHRIGLELTPHWPNRLTVTRLSDAV